MYTKNLTQYVLYAFSEFWFHTSGASASFDVPKNSPWAMFNEWHTCLPVSNNYMTRISTKTINFFHSAEILAKGFQTDLLRGLLFRCSSVFAPSSLKDPSRQHLSTIFWEQYSVCSDKDFEVLFEICTTEFLSKKRNLHLNFLIKVGVPLRSPLNILDIDVAINVL